VPLEVLAGLLALAPLVVDESDAVRGDRLRPPLPQLLEHLAAFVESPERLRVLPGLVVVDGQVTERPRLLVAVARLGGHAAVLLVVLARLLDPALVGEHGAHGPDDRRLQQGTIGLAGEVPRPTEDGERGVVVRDEVVVLSELAERLDAEIDVVALLQQGDRLDEDGTLLLAASEKVEEGVEPEEDLGPLLPGEPAVRVERQPGEVDGGQVPVGALEVLERGRQEGHRHPRAAPAEVMGSDEERRLSRPVRRGATRLALDRDPRLREQGVILAPERLGLVLAEDLVELVMVEPVEAAARADDARATLHLGELAEDGDLPHAEHARDELGIEGEALDRAGLEDGALAAAELPQARAEEIADRRRHRQLAGVARGLPRPVLAPGDRAGFPQRPDELEDEVRDSVGLLGDASRERIHETSVGERVPQDRGDLLGRESR
jgi:hypothetical protein